MYRIYLFASVDLLIASDYCWDLVAFGGFGVAGIWMGFKWVCG